MNIENKRWTWIESSLYTNVCFVYEFPPSNPGNKQKHIQHRASYRQSVRYRATATVQLSGSQTSWTAYILVGPTSSIAFSEFIQIGILIRLSDCLTDSQSNSVKLACSAIKKNCEIHNSVWKLNENIGKIPSCASP